MNFRRKQDVPAEQPAPGIYYEDGPVAYADPGYAEGDAGIDDGYIAYADVAPALAELDQLRADLAPALNELDHVRAELATALAETDQLRSERQALIELCLYARDRVSGAAADRIDSGLARIGVDLLRADGEPFDPGQHEAAASVPTDDPARHGTVAETEVPGYTDRGVVVRPPVVTVYRRETS